MKNLKKYWPAVIASILIIFIGAIIISKRQSSPTSLTPQAPTMILFFGDTCPHCKTVEEFISTNNIREKVQFMELEVYNNQANSQLLIKRARGCGLDVSNGAAVPMFYDGQKCYVGDQDIINLLKTK